MYPPLEEQYQALRPEDREIYDELRFSEEIDGWLLAEEAVELYRLAINTRACPAVFCEIGTWMGKSASILGKAALRHGNALVYAIDPFTGIGDRISVQEYQKKRSTLVKTQLETCRDNLRRSGVFSVVRLIPQESFTARALFQETYLDGLFIDGNHAYESVKEDVILWSPLLRSGGWLALHDVGAVHVDGPRRVTKEIRRDTDQWEDWRMVGEMAVARRR